MDRSGTELASTAGPALGLGFQLEGVATSWHFVVPVRPCEAMVYGTRQSAVP